MSKIYFRGQIYPYRSVLIRTVDAIRRRYQPNERVIGTDAAIVASVFDLHPERDQKIAGRKISHIEVRTYKYGTQAFFIVFTDGACVDFSFTKALKHAYPTGGADSDEA